LIFDKVTDKNKLAPFYGPRCTCTVSVMIVLKTFLFVRTYSSEMHLRTSIYKALCRSTYSRSIGW